MADLKQVKKLVANLSPADRADLMAYMHELVSKVVPSKFRPGTVVLVRWSSGNKYHGVILGGGRKAKVWFPDIETHSAYSVEWTSILEMNDNHNLKVEVFPGTRMYVPTEETVKFMRDKYGKETEGTY